MEDLDRVARLTPPQRECLDLYGQQYSVSEIATRLNISISAVNQRLRGGRTTLGVGSSQTAARMVVQYDRSRGIWIPPTGSENTVPETSLVPTDGPAQTAEGRSDDRLADSGSSGEISSAAVAPSLIVKPPFPTAGRPTNDLTATSRMGWALTLAILALALLMIVALLSLGVQDVLVGMQHTLARLH